MPWTLKHRIATGLVVLGAVIVPNALAHQFRARTPEYQRAARLWPSEVYHMATGASFLVRADCPDAEHGGQKPPQSMAQQRMREVIFFAPNEEAAARFVSDRYAGCRYMLVGRT